MPNRRLHLLIKYYNFEFLENRQQRGGWIHILSISAICLCLSIWVSFYFYQCLTYNLPLIHAWQYLKLIDFLQTKIKMLLIRYSFFHFKFNSYFLLFLLTFATVGPFLSIFSSLIWEWVSSWDYLWNLPHDVSNLNW